MGSFQHEKGRRRILPRFRTYIQDFVRWEESLDFIVIVPEAPLVIDTSIVMAAPGRSILDKAGVRYDPIYLPDPDTADSNSNCHRDQKLRALKNIGCKRVFNSPSSHIAYNEAKIKIIY